VQVIVRGRVKALCCDLAQGRRIWRGAHRSIVLCGVGFDALCM
jgi:hypothetical protein